MKKPTPVGLISEGKLVGSPLMRFRGLSEQLGPVKSSSYRVASRISNSLRAGHPVKDYAEFKSCRLILLCVPEERVPAVVSEMLSAKISWPGKAVVLYSAWLDSGALRELAARGAAVGSMSLIPGFEDLRYLLEGDRLAILASRRLVEFCGSRAVTMEGSCKPLYLAALTSTGSLLFAVLLAASRALQLAGIRPALAAAILEKQLARTLRSYHTGGRRAYPAPRELAGQLRALAAVDPELARYIEQSSQLASRLLEKRDGAGAGNS